MNTQWKEYFLHLQHTNTFDKCQSHQKVILNFFLAASKLRLDKLPDAITWTEGSFFTLTWFKYDFFILLDYKGAEITKVPEYYTLFFKDIDKCLNHLNERKEYYFSTSTY